jgi:hypothetical protein
MKTKRILNQIGVIFVTSLFILISSQMANAVCTGSSPTWKAANASVTEIQACITAANAGDTINVPAGTGSAAWSTYVNINKAVKIIGPGQNPDGTYKLKITWSGSYAFRNASGVNDWRVSGFEFDTATSQLAVDIYDSTGWRIDHTKYHNTASKGTGTFVRTGITTSDAIMGGVIDNNEVISGRILPVNNSVGSLLGGYIWNIDLTLGDNNTNTIYIEDNTFIAPSPKIENCVDASRGGNYVFRYNYVNNNSIMAHSIQTSAVRGTRKWEVYGNRFNSKNATSTYSALFFRGGTGVIFVNDFTSDVAYNYNIRFDNVRSSTSYSADDNTTQAGMCDGNHAWDGNEDATGWPCRDQIGTGSDQTLWTTGVVPVAVQNKVPAYLWANYDTGSLTSISIGSPDHIKTNRDFYTHNASFNGTSGVGSGKLANRPATCSPGVAYWATEQSYTDMTGMVGKNPSTPIKGTLYKCNASRQWEVYYTPYTYPHPLRGVDVPKSTLLVTSANGTVTSNPSGINCGSTCNADYDSNTSVTLTASANSGYKLTGWSGACSGTGTCTVDMAEARFVAANYAKTVLYSLTVSKHNASAGTVTSSDKIINCGSTCSANYESGKSVTLTATPLTNYRFAGWSGACSGTGTCTLNMTAAKSVKATFYWKTYFK